MTTIVINENIDIKKSFNSLIDLYKYVNEKFSVDVEELEKQENILNSSEYNNYDKLLSKINI